MTNPPSWRPQEPLSLGVVSAGKTMTPPLPARVMAGLATAVLAAVGIAAYAATDFLDIDPVETASVANGPAVSPKPDPKTETAASHNAMVAAANHVVTTRPVPAATVAAPVSESARPVTLAQQQQKPDIVSNNLRKGVVSEQIASSVFLPPASADHVAGLSPDVAIAESEAEVAKLEAQLGMGEPAPESEMEIARLERAASPSDAAAVPEEGDAAAMGGPYIPVPGDLQAVRVTRYVNLRDGPADEAKVIAVIPTNATVQAETDCGWCAVTYNGQSGYIYKGFLTGRGGGGAKATAGRSRAAKKLTGKPGLY
ncbi:MAG: SH3 domain-containing protein [Rhizobiaceae bacterium]